MNEGKDEDVRMEYSICSSCIYFEDRGLQTFIMQGIRGRPKSKVQVRYFCNAFSEFLSKLYSKCHRYEKVIIIND